MVGPLVAESLAAGLQHRRELWFGRDRRSVFGSVRSPRNSGSPLTFSPEPRSASEARPRDRSTQAWRLPTCPPPPPFASRGTDTRVHLEKPGVCAPRREQAPERRSSRAPSRTVAGGSYTGEITVVPHPDEPVLLTLLPPAEALKAARPVPNLEDLAIEGLTEAEWKAFEQALAER